jgi:uncharacterized membrane protein
MLKPHYLKSKEQIMTRTPDVEQPFVESDQREYHDSGITSTVAIAGHPLHPAIVTFPIGLLVPVVATDLAFWFTGDPFWARASFWLLVAGFLSGIVAAITGMLDFLKINRVRERRAGWAHMIGNVAALALTLANVLLRWNTPVEAVLPAGIILSTIVAGLLGITGWYGGELVYRHKIAVIGDTNRNAH